MKALLLVALLLPLALPPVADAWLPVCKEKEAAALGVHAYARLDCGPTAVVTVCPLVGDGPCRVVDLERVLS